MQYKGIIAKYRNLLPVTDDTPVITFHEGYTPLIFAKKLSDMLKMQIYLKCEGLNPTGSFKDRGMTLAISKAKEKNMKAVICASTGNTSASAAAYSAKADMKCVVLIPEGKISLGKLSQAVMHGAKIISINGNFDEALRLVKEISENYPIELVNSINPFRIEGQKTAAFEICDQLDACPDYLAIPVGNAGNITAYWKGFKQYFDIGQIDTLPKMIGFQAEGAAPIVRGHPIENPETIATAIRIGNPASWKSAVAASEESGGFIKIVSDDEILEAYKFVAGSEGVFCEPASAASIAGVIKLSKLGKIPDGSSIVCVLTGHGLKDPDRAIACGNPPIKISADLNSIIKTLEL